MGLIPKHWTDSSGVENLKRFLAINDVTGGWEGVAWDSALDALPPIFEISEWTEGLALVRWLAHRILPYPTFLWSEHQLASRLQVSKIWVAEMTSKSTAFSEHFASVRYGGALRGLFDARWWGDGVESILYAALGVSATDTSTVHRWLQETFNLPAEGMFSGARHVVCLSEFLQAKSELVSMDECVRVRLDGWPSHAHEAWMELDLVTELPNLRARVHPHDQEYLEV